MDYHIILYQRGKKESVKEINKNYNMKKKKLKMWILFLDFIFKNWNGVIKIQIICCTFYV